MLIVIYNEVISWIEALMLLTCYAIFCIILSYDSNLDSFVQQLFKIKLQQPANSSVKSTFAVNKLYANENHDQSELDELKNINQEAGIDVIIINENYSYKYSNKGNQF